jgi:ABC-type sugar transport system permease subunit
MNNHTTYALLVQSQEKGRAIMETAVYITCILSVVVAIIQFAGQPIPDPFACFD